MKELIEKLKDKNYVRALGLMTLEEQECFTKVGKENCLFYGDNTWMSTSGDKFLFSGTTYVIKPDYQPEPEYVDFEIEKRSIWLGIETGSNPLFPYVFMHLHCLPSLSNFEGFHIKDEENFINIVGVARTISEGKKVYARFKK